MTIWRIILLEELIDFQLIVKFVIIFGTPNFLTVDTSARL